MELDLWYHDQPGSIFLVRVASRLCLSSQNLVGPVCDVHRRSILWFDSADYCCVVGPKFFALHIYCHLGLTEQKPASSAPNETALRSNLGMLICLIEAALDLLMTKWVAIVLSVEIVLRYTTADTAESEAPVKLCNS